MPLKIGDTEVNTDALGVAFIAIAVVLIIIMGTIVKNSLVGKALEATKVYVCTCLLLAATARRSRLCRSLQGVRCMSNSRVVVSI